jgi:hypothetical protein
MRSPALSVWAKLEKRPSFDALDADGAAVFLVQWRADRIAAAHVLAIDLSAQRQVLARLEGEGVAEVLGDGES